MIIFSSSFCLLLSAWRMLHIKVAKLTLFILSLQAIMWSGSGVTLPSFDSFDTVFNMVTLMNDKSNVPG